MVQHVTFVPNTENDPEPEPNPPTVVLWRDDQTLKWGLAPEFSWPNPEGDQPVPIVFLPAIGEYLDWPGSTPTPIGPRPTPGTADQRFYVATSDKVIPLNDPVEKYHYAFVVCPADDPTCALTLDPALSRAPDKQQWQDGTGVWHDPEVENRNQP